MNSNVATARPKRVKFWVLLGVLALVATYLWRPIPELAFDLVRAHSVTWAWNEHKNRIRFESETWKAFPRTTNEWPHTQLLPVRIRMVDDLLRQHSFHGQSREEVERLLGPKTKTEYFSDWDLVFYLGPGRYGNAVGDSEWLVFRFDSNGRVKEHKIVHD